MKGLKSLSNGWLFGVSGRSVDPVLHGGPVLKRLRTGGSRRRNAMRDRSGPARVAIRRRDAAGRGTPQA